MESLKVSIVGIVPMLHHSARRFLNHLDPLTREFKALSKKRNKTDEDLATLSDLEYTLSLYSNKKGEPIIPAEILEAAMIAGARKSKAGKLAQVGITCDDAIMEYEGPKNLAGLLLDPQFRDIRPVTVGQAKVCRTRPVFNAWRATVNVTYDPQVANKSEVLGWLTAAGQYSGVGDFRPKFGRFMVEN